MQNGNSTVVWREGFLKGCELPSSLPTYRWLEENYELDPVMSDLSGRVNFDFFPASRIFFDHCDDPRLRKCTVMKCSQSAFTENAIMMLLRRIKERPITTMWAGATAQKTEEDVKKRLFPAIRGCKAVQEVSPDPSERERWGKRLVMFDTMNLLIRGANSVSGLRGDPVGLLIADERADWKKGRIHKVRQRLTTKAAPVEISIGAAGVKGDELHADWKEGSQTFIHFLCLKCNHSQPFRFGKTPSVYYDEPRLLGGIVWEENEITRPGGLLWDFEKLKTTVRYECEKCGHRFHNVEKAQLLKTCHEHHRNPQALPENFSLAVPALLLIWQKRSWGDIAVEFLKAVEAMRTGDIEPMIAFVTETLGEPWERRNEKQKESELLDRCGKYKMGERWMDAQNPTIIEPKTALVITFDRQQFDLRVLIRQWRKSGDSRLIYFGAKASYDDLREFQRDEKVKDKNVWGDDGGKMTSEFRQTCLRFGWNAMKGEDEPYFVYQVEAGKAGIRQGFRTSEFDPDIGTTKQGRAIMKAWLWARPWYLDKLQMFQRGGPMMPIYELPSDIPAEYVRQALANEWEEKDLSDGRTKGRWKTNKNDHAADMELMQLVVADAACLTRILRLPSESPGPA